ncbi:MAG: hypothetical protein M1824_005103 [Vezdaea acicularis]|nr:MAG: hypothetical protein M1824_005103 [Vezdaea acicularis]
MASLRSILITGATGKQGGAVIAALLSQPKPTFKILALTRNTTSASAKALAAKPNVSVIEGNLDDCSAIFAKTGKVWGVFSVQVPLGGGQTPKTEEAQGKALVDAAVANGVENFVYTSVDRGGPEKSEVNATYIPHFISKYNVEKHLVEKASTSPQKMSYTILRPTAFFDNLTFDFMGKAFGAMWATMGDKKLQFISTKDIGWFAAQAFLKPDEYHNKAISLAGDEINNAEAAEKFKKVTGKDMPVTYTFIGRAIRWAVGDMNAMLKWFEEEGYGADIPALKRLHPKLQNFEEWLTESSSSSK